MATDYELLLTARTKILTAMAANAGRPNYNIDGQQVTYDNLMDQLAKLNAMLAAIGGPIEVETQGVL